MSYLLLIKHSTPEIQPELPANQWHLSDEGRKEAHQLAPALVRFNPMRLFSSEEPKAIETSTILARSGHLTSIAVAGLHEHLRNSGDWSTREKFEGNILAFFANPDEVIFGEETASQARSRFAFAIDKLIEDNVDDTVAVVAHGTVITLFVCTYNQADPYHFWQSLTMPSMVVLSRPDFQLAEVVSLNNEE
jgi:broad specificity phosphatase PhoE